MLSNLEKISWVLTFLQLDVEPAAFVLQIGAVGHAGADPAVEGGGGRWRGPGQQSVGQRYVGQRGVAAAGLWGASRQGSRVAAEPETNQSVISYSTCMNKHAVI